MENNIDFIKGSISEVHTFMPNPKTFIREFEIHITKNNEERTFHPVDYLNLVLENYYVVIDKEKGEANKYSKSLDAKRTLIHLIEDYKEEMNKIKSEIIIYDFSSVLIKADSTVNLLKERWDSEEKIIKVKNLKREKLKFWIGVIKGFISGAIVMLTVLAKIYFAWLKCK